VLGLTKSQANAKLDRSGLHERWLPSVYSLKYPAGQVAVETDGGRVTHGSTVTLRLSLGPRTHLLGDYSNQSVSAVKSALSDLHINVDRTVIVHSATVHKGLVVGTVPAAGRTVKEGSAVTLRVSNGPQHVLIPPVQGLTQTDATTALKSAGFTVVPVQHFSATVPTGNVITSHPTEGRKAIKGSTVTLVVSQGPRLFQVPNVEQQSLSDAIKAIHDAGFKAAPKQLFPGGPGIVDRESPTGMQPHGTTIELDYY